MSFSTPGVAGAEGTFAKGILLQLQSMGYHAPTTDQNITFLRSWFYRENGQGAYNPLGTDGGAVPYSSWEAGVVRAAQFIANGNYPDILDGLDYSASPDYWRSPRVARDFATWSHNGYTGIDVPGASAGTAQAQAGQALGSTPAQGISFKFSGPLGSQIDLSPVLWSGLIVLGAGLMLGGVTLLALMVLRGQVSAASQLVQTARAPGRWVGASRGRSGPARATGAPARPTPTAPAQEPAEPRQGPRLVRVGSSYYREGSTGLETARYRQRSQRRQRDIIARGNTQSATPPQRRAARRALRVRAA